MLIIVLIVKPRPAEAVVFKLNWAVAQVDTAVAAIKNRAILIQEVLGGVGFAAGNGVLKKEIIAVKER